jgi:hypothetical protein
MKVLVHDGIGLWLCARRLHQGTFTWANATRGASVSLSSEQLRALVIGLPSTSFGIAVDATGLYWIEGPGSLANHEIKRLTPNGEVIPIAQVIQYPLGLSVGPGGVLYTDPYDFSADPRAPGRRQCAPER